ncbi:sulfotransferase 1E1-like isoform X2 [Saccostrea echinata]|uniref:sulfotransferase 1E1-like isoform X2 n=1 Tax=Saccostrea echinata TaxID=191078 RepID=UPI002A80798A|nr:sulfotransferase 1E1-like isoform X2 [Saccostrea echinata]
MKESDERIVFDGMTVPPFAPLKKNAKERFEEIRNLEYKEDDVILTTFPKSGTNWFWEIICMLLKGKAEYVKEAKVSVFLEAIPDLNVVHGLASPRALNTHVPYRWLPKQHLERNGKIVHVIRNPKDVAVSMYYHFKSSGNINDDCHFKTFLEQIFLSAACPMGSWFDYEKEFEQAKTTDKDHIILTVHYESMKKNPIEETRRLGKFLNVELSDQQIADIVDKCSFQKLRHAAETFKDLSHREKITDTGEGAIRKPPNIYRKGEIGDWKNHFTVAMSEHFDTIFREKMKDSNIQVQFE